MPNINMKWVKASTDWNSSPSNANENFPRLLFEKCVCLFIHPWYTTAISCLPIISHDTEKKNHALKKTRGNEKMFPLRSPAQTVLMRQNLDKS